MFIYGGAILAVSLWVAVTVYLVRKYRAGSERRLLQNGMEGETPQFTAGGDLSGDMQTGQTVVRVNQHGDVDALRARMDADAQATLDRVRAADQARIRELEVEQQRLARQVAVERERADRRANPFDAIVDQMLEGVRPLSRDDLLRRLRNGGTVTETTTTTTVRRNGRPVETTTTTSPAPAPAAPPPAPQRTWYDRLRDPWPTTNESPTDPPPKKT